MIFETKSEHELDSMSVEGLIAENQRTDAVVQELRDYKRNCKQRWSELQRLEAIKAKHGDISDEDAKRIDAIVNAPRLSLKAGVKEV